MDLSKIREYGNLELLAKQMVEGFITGLHKSPYHGFSVEFAEHRLYNPGESTRHVDWKVYAKTGRLYTKRYEEETNLRCMILLDCSSSMYYPMDSLAKLNFSIFGAASLAYLLQKQRDAVGFCSFSEDIEQLTAIKSTSSHIHNLFLQLQQLEKKKQHQKKTAVADVIHKIAKKLHKRSLVIIFSDMMDNTAENEKLFSALQHLKHDNHEVLLFHVFDKKTEYDFQFEERPYLFQDLETGTTEKVQPSQVKDYYQKMIFEKYEAIKMKCGQYKIDFIEADVNQNIDQILLPYLIKRGRMG